MTLFERGETHVRVGEFVVDWNVRQPDDAPLLDGGTVTLHRFDDERDILLAVESYGGLVFRLPWSTTAVAIARRDTRVPNPARWRPRFMLARLRWRLAGRPERVASLTDGTPPRP